MARNSRNPRSSSLNVADSDTGTGTTEQPETTTAEVPGEGRTSPLPASGDFGLTPPGSSGDDPGGAAPRTRRRYTPRRPKTRGATPEPTVEAKPDESLVKTCTGGVVAITDLAQQKLGFSDPGKEWTDVMGELSARWVMRLESSWLQEHPLEAQILLHLSVYLVPNSLILGGKLLTKYSKKKNAERSNGSLREETHPEDTLDN